MKLEPAQTSTHPAIIRSRSFHHGRYRRGRLYLLNFWIILSILFSNVLGAGGIFNAGFEKASAKDAVVDSETSSDAKQVEHTNASITGLSYSLLEDVACPEDEDLTIGASESCYWEPGVYTYTQITIEDGGTIIVHGDPIAQSGVTIYADTFMLAGGGTLSAGGQGFASNSGPGAGIIAGLGASSSGGGHGGWGGKSSTAGGSPYGDYQNPVTLGSGGGSHGNQPGGSGGGAIHLIATDSVVVSGTLQANGTDGGGQDLGGSGGGAGGSIWIEAANIGGNGLISADGGNGINSGYGYGGGGSGGRITIDVPANTFSGSIHAFGGDGGQDGGAGTIYLAAEDRLIVNDNNDPSASAALLTGNYAISDIELTNHATLSILGTNSVLTVTQNTLNGDSTGTLIPYGWLSLPSTFELENTIVDIQGGLTGVEDLSIGNQGQLILHSNTPLHSGPNTFNNLTVEAAGKLTLIPSNDGDSDYTDDGPADIIAGTITIISGGVLESDGLGYAGTSGNGSGPGGGLGNSSIGYRRGGGGGYGGEGGDGGDVYYGGAIYGDATEPIFLGSAGGAGVVVATVLMGANGGGAIRLDVTQNLIVNGLLSANGASGAGGTYSGATGGSGGGSGGSIWVSADQLVGSGSIQAKGGDAPYGGGGGGGRIAIYANSIDSGLDLSVAAGSGFESNNGAAGTIFRNELDPVNSQVSVSPNQIRTDGYSTGTITVTIRNVDGYPMPDQNVRLELESGNEVVLNNQLTQLGEFVDAGLTDSNGVITATITAEIVGERAIRPYVDDQPLQSSGLVTFIPGPVDDSLSSITTERTTASADGVTPVTITVQAMDAYQNLIQGATVVLTATGSAQVTQPLELTNSQGEASGSIHNDVAEPITVTASVDGVLLADTAAVLFREADLAISMSAVAPTNQGLSNSQATAGYPITYTITVVNEGLSQAENVVVTDTLPAGITPNPASFSPPYTLLDGDNIVWNLGRLEVNQNATLQFVAQIDAWMGGRVITNTVQASTTSLDESPTNNQAFLGTEILQPGAVLTVVPILPTLGVRRGYVATQAFRVTNSGLASVFDVAIGAPPNIPWVAVEPASIPVMAASETVTITLTASPGVTITRGYYYDYVTVAAEFHNTQKVGFMAHVYEGARYPLTVEINNDLGHTLAGAQVQLTLDAPDVRVDQGNLIDDQYYEHATKITGQDGSVHFATLEAGNYFVSISALHHDSLTATLMVGGPLTQTYALSALPALGVSPTETTLGVKQGETQQQTFTIHNYGAAPLENLVLTPPASLPWLALVQPDDLSELAPGESQEITILASPPITTSVGQYIDSIQVASGEMEAVAEVHIDVVAWDAPEERNLQLTFTNDEGGAVSSGRVLLTGQDPISATVNGVLLSYQPQFSRALDENGVAVFDDLPSGDYLYKAFVDGFEPGSGSLIVQPGGGTQYESAILKTDHFRYSWVVTRIDDVYKVTLHMIYESGLDDGSVEEIPPPPPWCTDCESSDGEYVWDLPWDSGISVPGGAPPVRYGGGKQYSTIELSQNILLEGEGFSAHLGLENITSSDLTYVSIQYKFTDSLGNEAADDFSLVYQNHLPGTIGSGSQAEEDVFILPTIATAIPLDGLCFLVSAEITYRYQGVEYTFDTVPQWIIVSPAPKLELDYKLPSPSYYCTEFDLRLTLTNTGEGWAHNVRINVAQPNVTDYTGKPVILKIISAMIDDNDQGQALNLTLGDIPPGGKVTITWRLHASKPGRFVDFWASLNHDNPFNLPLHPLISQVTTELVPTQCILPMAMELFAGPVYRQRLARRQRVNRRPDQHA
ncbi:MAG: Ig-like domain-containing protein [Chloroflexi bacterium]|nr:Ig-like domain-containing protein [Chloroflexota bacterium]